MKLHLGCGKRDFGADWIHIDCGNYSHLNSHIITQLPFGDNSCDLIYASHVIGYFDREEIIEVLREWYRVLKSPGLIRLAVPDFEAMARLYVNKSWKLIALLGPLYGKMIPSDCAAIYHKTTYDFESLRTLLLDIGFCNVCRYDWRQTEHAYVDDHSQAYLPHMDKENGTLISLNIEGTKGNCNDLV